MSGAGITPERVYLLLREAEKKIETQDVRIQVLEHFIRERFPEYFAGEAGTTIDPELKAIELTFGEPQERLNEQTQKWERRNATGDWEQQ